jgi:hypothetical protein
LREVVSALAEGDYALRRGISSIVQVSARVADQIRAYLADFGETLVELPDETWRTSVSQWMGTYWEVLVDLWTAESGPSDLVLGVRVHEHEGGVRIEIDSVRVP